jgi:hypothetical protein
VRVDNGRRPSLLPHSSMHSALVAILQSSTNLEGSYNLDAFLPFFSGRHQSLSLSNLSATAAAAAVAASPEHGGGSGGCGHGAPLTTQAEAAQSQPLEPSIVAGLQGALQRSSALCSGGLQPEQSLSRVRSPAPATVLI